jgi:DNA-binding NarL/FixJ family response regulator
VTGPGPSSGPVGSAPRVLLVDDQALVRTGFRMILSGAGLEVVGEAADGHEAIAAVRRQRPDIVLMDIRMPTMDGLEATRRILDTTPDPAPKIIMLTTFDLDRYVYAALSAGASGFLLKDTTPEQLIASVRLVNVGDALLAPAITRRLVARFARSDQPGIRHHDLSTLTPRELGILTLLGKGLSNGELAEHLALSEATVKSHVAHIFTKLHLRDRAQAVVIAYESGLIAPGQQDNPV